eukprot:m.1638020 g.1638020  ORF g.1638020 m.1638020 type:complete len:349 (-) comp26595_c0_seq1:331-1377(-)
MNEPKRKQKWGLDPQNKQWANDTSKFGYKMMEKMGWQNGQGLGTNNSGMTEHVKVTTKNNNLGIGATTKDNDYAWLRVQDTFNSVLDDLNAVCGSADGTIPTAPPPDSVLDSSKVNKKRGSRLRMFESRFRKGKDLSVMGTDDLACILGKSEKRPERLRKSATKASGGDEVDDKQEQSSKGDTTGMVTTTSTYSVNDYFAKRMAEIKAKKNGSADATDTSAVAGPSSRKRKGSAKGEKAKLRKKGKKSKKDKESGEDDCSKSDTPRGEAGSSDKCSEPPEAAAISIVSGEEINDRSTKKKKKSAKKSSKKSIEKVGKKDKTAKKQPQSTETCKSEKAKKKKSKKARSS